METGLNKLAIPNGWKLVFLSEVGSIIPSNVDKKIHPSELLISLCNYMDVYSNAYLSKHTEFSQGSVTNSELIKFKLQKEDVIITKDSETPDDIAIPSVVVDELKNVVCGYHLALIRPDLDQITGQFLSKTLQTTLCRRHFGNFANGSTRYGLSQKAIFSCPILLPPIIEQRVIARILLTVDQVIEKTEQLIAKYERIKIGLMQDLLTRGIDEQGNLRSEETHAFKDSALGRIPVEWKITTISDLCKVNPPKKKFASNFSVTFLGMVDVSDDAKVIGGKEVKYEEVSSGFTSFIETDILVAKITPCFENGKGAFAENLKNGVGFGSTEFHVLRSLENTFGKLIYHFTTSSRFRNAGNAVMTGSAGQQRVQKSFFSEFKFAFPKSLNEQIAIAKILDEQDDFLEKENKKLMKCKRMKTALTQDLLTGKVRVDALMQQGKALQSI